MNIFLTKKNAKLILRPPAQIGPGLNTSQQCPTQLETKSGPASGIKQLTFI